MNKGVADIAKIQQVLEQSTAKELSTNTGISLSNIKKWKSGERSIERMNLTDAIKLTDYANRNLSAEIVIWRE
ncbi:hypothetical protein DKK47_RS11360 [Enterococcus faecium]|uniref:hypothetical protein n=1 Tax=Enterococcus TaxID=1350 RepID=UPI000F4F29A0|nr:MULTISPECIES: hypothetical protein [Enterococcus]EGP5553319.1 hypothetical protein [Enterococcus faecium]EGP5585046.1 hypothetical protein [Enterococcus faecium]EGP5735366.1 hypothetical protein [Enterococcus faecium]EME3569357.1 hypothetical protein [Enterococcus faecium]EME7156249.1 hypothetical protein [Enterococcus faecium]